MPDPSLPASTTPVQDYLDRPAPGATADHLVVPRSLAQSMPLRWQQVFVGLLADLHDAYAELPWPDYRVVPSRWERLVDLDDEQLQAPGYLDRPRRRRAPGVPRRRGRPGRRPGAAPGARPDRRPPPAGADGRVEPRPAASLGVDVGPSHRGTLPFEPDSDRHSG